MKLSMIVGCFLLLLTTATWAQDNDLGYSQGGAAKKHADQVGEGEDQRKPGEPLPPKMTGVVIMMSEKGLQVINPRAPKEMGIGQKVLTQSYAHNPNGTPDASHMDDPKPFGGISLFGWEF